VVDSTDDLGRASQAERSFSLNNTLASLTVGAVRRGGTVTGSFTLSRPAQVRGTILTASGAPLRTLAPRSLAAGPGTITWNGRSTYGSLVRAGRYQLRVTASNAVGTVSLIAPFTITRR
jgi:flagellar hook assembly protein FlgD